MEAAAMALAAVLAVWLVVSTEERIVAQAAARATAQMAEVPAAVPDAGIRVAGT